MTLPVSQQKDKHVVVFCESLVCLVVVLKEIVNVNLFTFVLVT